MARGLVFDIRRFCVHDGPGIRTTVFLKGCPLSCAWCHNPEGVSPLPQMGWRRARCVRCGACAEACPNQAIQLLEAGPTADPQLCRQCGLCADACPSGARIRAGTWMTVPELIAETLKDRAFFEESAGGVTFSGGEPTAQAEFLNQCCEGLKKLGVHVAVDTCAYGPVEVFERLLGCVDLFLVDLKAVSDEQSLRWTGVPLGPILENAKMLASSGKASFAMPLIPGVNDDTATVTGVAATLREIGSDQIALLPYHKMGQDKHNSFGRNLESVVWREPTPKELEQVIETFTDCGIHARIGSRTGP